MKNFIKKSLLFLLMLAFILLTIEICIRLIPNTYSVKHSTFRKKIKKIETLILGSSHSYYGINPNYIDGITYNLAMISQNIVIDYRLIKENLNRMTSLKNLVIPVSYFSLSHEEGEGEDLWRYYYYYHIYDLDIDVQPYSLKKYSLTATFTFSSTVKHIVKYFLGRLNYNTKNGWIKGYPLRGNIDFDKHGKKVAKRHENNKFDFKKNLELLEEVIEYCEEKKVKLFFVTLPAYKTYRNRVNQEKFELIKNSMEDLTINRNSVYLNFFSDTTFSKLDFYDSDHLNIRGAERLSIKLNSYINSKEN